MRNLQHRPPFTSVFTSKGFVVALCAAIAMVLGTMSVGTNAPAEYESPAVTSSPSEANRANTFVGDDNSGGHDRAEATKPLAPSYINYQMPVIISPDSSGDNLPVTTSPAKELEVKLKLKPLEASAATPSAALLLEARSPLLDKTAPTDSPLATESPLQNADTLTKEVLSQTIEPDPEHVVDTPTE